MPTLLAYHGDAEIKKKFVNHIAAHHADDELEQVTGCEIGCCFHTYGQSSRGLVEIGMPVDLMNLEESIFLGLPAAERLAWRLNFLQAIEPGADLSPVWPRLREWRTLRAQRGENRRSSGDEAGLHRYWRECADKCIELIKDCRA